MLEKWMTPSLFAGFAARDETSLCAELGRERAAQRLRAQWDAFVSRDDFAWLAGIGIDSVRIPLGHWIFGPPYPYHESYGANWCLAAESTVYNCSTAIVIGQATKS